MVAYHLAVRLALLAAYCILVAFDAAGWAIPLVVLLAATLIGGPKWPKGAA